MKGQTMIVRTSSDGSDVSFNADQVDWPEWLDKDHFTYLGDFEDDELHQEYVWGSSIRDICRGGCASGSYMPAVTYYDALRTMAEHGDEVLSYIWEQLGEHPWPADDVSSFSWSGMACHYLSLAVELWASGIEAELDEADEHEAEEVTS